MGLELLTRRSQPKSLWYLYSARDKYEPKPAGDLPDGRLDSDGRIAMGSNRT